MGRFIDALNRLGGQPAGIFLIACGVALGIYYKHAGIASDDPGGLIVGGVALLRQDAHVVSTTVQAPNAQTQIVSTQTPSQPQA